VNGVRDDVASDTALINVLVATQPITRGASADKLLADGSIAVAKRRRIDLPPDAISVGADIRGQRAAIAMQPNELITAAKFVSDSDLSPSNAANLDKGNVAIAVSTDKVRGVSNLVEPGDYVNLMIGVDRTGSAPTAESILPEEQVRASTIGTPVFMLYQKVKVLAIDSDLGTAVSYEEPTDGSSTPIPSATQEQQREASTVVFQVPPDAATLIAGAEKSGGIYMTLVRPDYEPVAVPGVISLPELPGEKGQTPYPEVPGPETPEGSG
jgi:Flp pilus assembly protein CpaB